MATIALPRLSAPSLGGAQLKGLVTNRYVGLVAAALLLAGAAFGVVKAVGPVAPGAAKVRVSLTGVLARAPEGWRETLAPLHGPAHITART